MYSVVCEIWGQIRTLFGVLKEKIPVVLDKIKSVELPFCCCQGIMVQYSSVLKSAVGVSVLDHMNRV